jgi:hypothetical protein
MPQAKTGVDPNAPNGPIDPNASDPNAQPDPSVDQTINDLNATSAQVDAALAGG